MERRRRDSSEASAFARWMLDTNRCHRTLPPPRADYGRAFVVFLPDRARFAARCACWGRRCAQPVAMMRDEPTAVAAALEMAHRCQGSPGDGRVRLAAIVARNGVWS